MVSLSKAFKKSKSISKGMNNKKGNSAEEKWICLIVVVLLVLIAYVIQYSMQNAHEKFLKSDYHISLNNVMYDLQGQNATVLLVNFKPKTIKKHKNSTDIAFVELFEETKNKTKLHNLGYEVLKSMKYEVFARLYLNNSQNGQDNLYGIQEENVNMTKIGQQLDYFIKILKKSKKVLTIEYRSFNTLINPKQKSQYISGQHTKGRDTIDYKIRFHHGLYHYIDPVQKNVTSQQPDSKVVEIIDDTPFDLEFEKQQQQDDLLDKDDISQSQDQDIDTTTTRIVLNKYEQIMKDNTNIATDSQKIESKIDIDMNTCTNVDQKQQQHEDTNSCIDQQQQSQNKQDDQIIENQQNIKQQDSQSSNGDMIQEETNKITSEDL